MLYLFYTYFIIILKKLLLFLKILLVITKVEYMNDNCIDYESQQKIPCKDIEYETFDDYKKYSAKNFNDFIYDPANSNKGKYDYDQFKFNEDYINTIPNEKDEFKLTHPQMFVPKYANYHNNFQGLLVYHGLGSGKTCTSILVGEAYKAYKNQEEYIVKQSKVYDKDDDNRVIVVLRPSLVNQFKNELTGVCVQKISYKNNKIVYTNPIDLKKLPKTARRLSQTIIRDESNSIVKYWNITTHIKFILGLVGRKENDNNTLLEFSNTLRKGGKIVIIDEIQNLISESGTMYNTLITMIRMFSHNNRFIVLSATPIYDKPFEIGLVMNLLNPRLYFPESQNDFNKLFFESSADKKDSKMKNKDLFYWMCSGYISYFSGGNPRDFPFKRVIEKHHRMSEEQAKVYLNQLSNDVKNETIEDETKSKKSSSKTSSKTAKELLNDKTKDEINETIAQSYLSASRQFCNIVFEEDIKEFEKSSTIPTKNKLDRDKLMLKTLKSQLKKAAEAAEAEKSKLKNIMTTIGKYSSKMADIASIVLKSKYKSFIFSDLRCYGVDAMGVILESLGFMELKETDLKDITTFLKKNKDKPVFTLWTGDIQKKEEYSEGVLKLFNSEENKTGELLKVILGTDTIKEGISLIGVTDVHIMNPWWNESHFEQVIARAIRLKSHKIFGTDEGKKYVNIYKHLSVFDDFPRTSALQFFKDNVSTTQSERRTNKMNMIRSRGLFNITVDQHINKRSKLKKNASREFEVIMKSSAVDCKLNKYGNLIRLTECIEPLYESNAKEYVVYYENNTTGYKYFKSIAGTLMNNINSLEGYITTIPYLSNEPSLKFEPISIIEEEFNGSGSRVNKYIRDTSKGELTMNSSEYKITKEYIINENIDCELNNTYRYVQNKNKQVDELVKGTVNYKESMFNGKRIVPIMELVNSIYSSPSTNNYYNEKKELIKCVSKIIENNESVELKDKLEKFVKISGSNNTMLQDKMFEYITLINKTYNDTTMRQFIISKKELDEDTVKSFLATNNITEELFMETITSVRANYDMLENIGYDFINEAIKKF